MCFFVGAVMLSPSPRALVCHTGDSLVVTCSVTESSLIWRLILMGRSETIQHDIPIASTTIVIQRRMINSSRLTAFRTSERGARPLITMLEISPVNEALNGTVTIACMELGTLAPMETTTIYIAGNYRDKQYYISGLKVSNSSPAMHLGISIYPSPPIVQTKEKFRMDEVVIGLQWTQETYENLYVSYNISTEPEIDATVTLISNTHANLTLSYNTQYNVSVVADLCGHQATTIIEIHYGGCKKTSNN